MSSHRDNNQKSESSLNGYVACIAHLYRDEDIESLKLYRPCLQRDINSVCQRTIDSSKKPPKKTAQTINATQLLRVATLTCRFGKRDGKRIQT